MQARSKRDILLPIVISGVFIIGLVVGFSLGNVNGAGFLSSGKSSALQEISTLIKNKYVDSIDVDSLTEYAADELLTHLDPHSVYIPANELQRVNDQMGGHFTGIGMYYNFINDTINILQIFKNSPAQKVGLKVGDKILKVNDSINLTGKNITDAIARQHLQGAEGSVVALTISSNNQIKKINVTRQSIALNSIDVAYKIDAKTGYIKINKFAERTYEEFMQHLEQLQKQKIDNLIIDLRDNGGGYLHAATAIADEFLDGDKLIVYTQGNKQAKLEYRCKKEGLFETGKLVVLINEASASASEVLAGALQDWDRATIIGKRSFGKGLVQQQFNLSNGAALRLTVARYYTPIGRNIQKPYTADKRKYMHEVAERGDDTKLDSINITKHSFKTMGGKIVYGGGGITPDFLVADSSKHYNFGYAAYYYFMNNKTNLLLLKTPQLLDSFFAKGNINWNSFTTHKQIDSLVTNNPASKLQLVNELEDYAAKNLLTDVDYYSLLNKHDAVVLKALEVLSK